MAMHGVEHRDGSGMVAGDRARDRDLELELGAARIVVRERECSLELADRGRRIPGLAGEVGEPHVSRALLVALAALGDLLPRGAPALEIAAVIRHLGSDPSDARRVRVQRLRLGGRERGVPRLVEHHAHARGALEREHRIGRPRGGERGGRALEPVGRGAQVPRVERGQRLREQRIGVAHPHDRCPEDSVNAR